MVEFEFLTKNFKTSTVQQFYEHIAKFAPVDVKSQ